MDNTWCYIQEIDFGLWLQMHKGTMYSIPVYVDLNMCKWTHNHIVNIVCVVDGFG
jgi:hypothetical protein